MVPGAKTKITYIHPEKKPYHVQKSIFFIENPIASPTDIPTTGFFSILSIMKKIYCARKLETKNIYSNSYISVNSARHCPFKSTCDKEWPRHQESVVHPSTQQGACSQQQEITSLERQADADGTQTQSAVYRGQPRGSARGSAVLKSTNISESDLCQEVLPWCQVRQCQRGEKDNQQKAARVKLSMRSEYDDLLILVIL